MTDALPLAAIAYAGVGLAAGLAYFAALRVNVGLYLDGSGRWRPLVLHAVRIAAAVALFWLLATRGAAPLVAALVGFLAARLILQRRKEPRP